MSEEAIVLAAGKGTRMRSSLPKVLHPLAGKPMLVRVLDAVRDAGFARPAVVVGYGAEQIQERVGERCRWVLQDEQLGTGHAARLGLEATPSRGHATAAARFSQQIRPEEKEVIAHGTNGRGAKLH